MSFGALHRSNLSSPLPDRPAETGSRWPFLSIVIPAFNEARYLPSTLESVYRARSRYRGAVEVIVVDNNSSDGTDAVARLFGAKVVFEPFNQIARARNAGAAAASGEVLVFLDADTTVAGDILDKVARRMAGGRVIGGGAWTEPDSGGPGRLLFKYGVNPLLALGNVTVGPFLYCDPEAFRKVGGFDETLFAAEEFSLARRLKAAGRGGQRRWAIIRYGRAHRVVTSGRKFSRFGGLEMLVRNLHLVWRPQRKLKQKSQCGFWYEPIGR